MNVKNNMENDNKCKALNTKEFLETFENSASKYEVKCPESTTKNTEPGLKCRYLVTLFGFFINFHVNCYRLNTSISIVAMVSKSVPDSIDFKNISIVSCPSNLREVEENYKEPEGNFDWNPEIQGYILGASPLGYVVTLIPGGIMAEKISAKMTIAIGVVIPSLCFLISPFTAWSSKYLLIVVQFICGMGQGLIPAALSVLAANWLPINERGLMNTIMMSGYCAGALVGGVATGVLCSSSLLGGWSSVFYIFGTLGIIFSVLLQIFVFESPKKHPRITDSELKYILINQELNLSGKRPPIPWRKIFTSVPFYALNVARIGQFWAAIHFLSVHPTFLGTILHYPIQKNGLFASVPFVLQTFLAVLGSCISGWLNRNKYTGVDKVRKGCHFLFCLGYSLCLLGIYAAGCDTSRSAPFSILAMGLVGLSYAGCMITAIDMSPAFAGTIMGLSSVASSLSAFLLPVLVGLLTKEEQILHQWNKVFFISIAIVMTSGIIFWIFGSAEVQDWNFPASENSESYVAESNKKNTTTSYSTDIMISNVHL